jgi:hypothetical protein
MLSSDAKRRKARNLPQLGRIAVFWLNGFGSGACPDGIRNEDWGEPFCFRCYWKAPVPDANQTGGIEACWDLASGWLERAHLHDRVYGGPDAVENLMPLCVLCHVSMPVSRSFDEGLRWISTGPRRAMWWQQFTDLMDPINGGDGRFSKPDFIAAYLRMGEVIAGAQHETGKVVNHLPHQAMARFARARLVEKAYVGDREA